MTVSTTDLGKYFRRQVRWIVFYRCLYFLVVGISMSFIPILWSIFTKSSFSYHCESVRVLFTFWIHGRFTSSNSFGIHSFPELKKISVQFPAFFGPFYCRLTFSYSSPWCIWHLQWVPRVILVSRLRYAICSTALGRASESAYIFCESRLKFISVFRTDSLIKVLMFYTVNTGMIVAYVFLGRAVFVYFWRWIQLQTWCKPRNDHVYRNA